MLKFKIVDGHDGDTVKTGIGLIKDVQRHPVTDEYIHFDILEVQVDKTVTIDVHTVLVGESEAIKVHHGIIEHRLRTLMVECLPNKIPAHIEIDISSLKIGDNIKVEDLVLPEGVKVLEDPEEVILSVLAPLKEEEEAIEEEEVIEGEEGAEEEEEKAEESDKDS